MAILLCFCQARVIISIVKQTSLLVGGHCDPKIAEFNQLNKIGTYIVPGTAVVFLTRGHPLSIRDSGADPAELEVGAKFFVQFCIAPAVASFDPETVPARAYVVMPADPSAPGPAFKLVAPLGRYALYAHALGKQ